MANRPTEQTHRRTTTNFELKMIDANPALLEKRRKQRQNNPTELRQKRKLKGFGPRRPQKLSKRFGMSAIGGFLK